jgi:hypothetical protein
MPRLDDDSVAFRHRRALGAKLDTARSNVAALRGDDELLSFD